MGTALFSACGKYRYMLSRDHISPLLDPNLVDAPYINFLMLNPSTADHQKNDPTVAKCEKWAWKWGYQQMIVTNLFALRSTNPKALYYAEDPIGPDNDHYVLEYAYGADKVIAAWGMHGRLRGRASWFLANFKKDLHVLRLGAEQPWHPLYLPNSTEPILWER